MDTKRNRKQVNRKYIDEEQMRKKDENTEQHMTDIYDAKKDLTSITNYYRVDCNRPILLARKTIKDLIYTYFRSDQISRSVMSNSL